MAHCVDDKASYRCSESRQLDYLKLACCKKDVPRKTAEKISSKLKTKIKDDHSRSDRYIFCFR